MSIGIIIRRFPTENRLKTWLEEKRKELKSNENYNVWLMRYLAGGNLLIVGDKPNEKKYCYVDCVNLLG